MAGPLPMDIGTPPKDIGIPPTFIPIPYPYPYPNYPRYPYEHPWILEKVEVE